MAFAENISQNGFDLSLREMPGPRRTFDSPESNLPLPREISYYQVLYPPEERPNVNHRIGEVWASINPNIKRTAAITAGVVAEVLLCEDLRLFYMMAPEPKPNIFTGYLLVAGTALIIGTTAMNYLMIDGGVEPQRESVKC